MGDLDGVRLKEAVNKANDRNIIALKKSRARLEQEIASIRDRVRDIEWQLDGTDTTPAGFENLISERQRALDKLRQTQKELLSVREQLIEEGVE